MFGTQDGKYVWQFRPSILSLYLQGEKRTRDIEKKGGRRGGVGVGGDSFQAYFWYVPSPSLPSPAGSFIFAALL